MAKDDGVSKLDYIRLDGQNKNSKEIKKDALKTRKHPLISDESTSFSFKHKTFIDKKNKNHPERSSEGILASITKKLQLPKLNQKEKSSKPKKNNLPKQLNSITAVFNRNREEVKGIDRVFRKSTSVLVLQQVSFFGLVIASLNLFNFNLVLSIFLMVLSIAITNVFFIVVADRSYVWLSLIGQALLILIANSFLGLGFEFTTLVLIFLVVLFYFLSYSELEKVQLSSRLFSISHITTESSRILLTAATILISLGVFNSIVYEGIKDGEDLGSGPFMERVVFSNDILMENIIIGQSSRVSVNNYLMDGKLYQSVDDDGFAKIVYNQVSAAGSSIQTQADLRYFLTNNYKETTLIGVAREEELRRTEEPCITEGAESINCDLAVQTYTDELLLAWRDELGLSQYSLDQKLDVGIFAQISTRYYLYQIQEFEQAENTDDSGIIPAIVLELLNYVNLSYVIPAAFALTVFIFLTLTKFVWGWIVMIMTWLFWKILSWFGFVHIDIETVEAEIVSI